MFQVSRVRKYGTWHFQDKREVKSTLDQYRAHRDKFITEVVTAFSNDERFAAAWLTGSLGRDEADSVSDVDISLVISYQHSETFFVKPVQVTSQTTPEGLSLFSQFGKPALIHENNNNAPEGGTFTFVLYENTAIMVDWVLIPESRAKRPAQSLLLFDKVDIPLSPLPEIEDLEQSKKSVLEKWAFFWMMMAITIKYILRQDSVFVTQWIENLHGIIHEIERQINRDPWKYSRGSRSKISVTREEQLESLGQLCKKMLEIKPKVAEFIGKDPATPLTEIETLLSLVSNRQIVNQKSQIVN